MIEVKDTDGVRYLIDASRVDEFERYVIWLDNCTGSAWSGFDFTKCKIVK